MRTTDWTWETCFRFLMKWNDEQLPFLDYVSEGNVIMRATAIPCETCLLFLRTGDDLSSYLSLRDLLTILKEIWWWEQLPCLERLAYETSDDARNCLSLRDWLTCRREMWWCEQLPFLERIVLNSWGNAKALNSCRSFASLQEISWSEHLPSLKRIDPCSQGRVIVWAAALPYDNYSFSLW